MNYSRVTQKQNPPREISVDKPFKDDAAELPNHSWRTILVERKAPGANVCIAFSSRGTEIGKFTFYKMLSDFPGHVIFINDHQNGWYLDGTVDLREPVLSRWLASEVDRLRSSGGRLFTLGSSMGAYAALKYGQLLKADRVLAFGPEVELGLPLGRSIACLKSVPPDRGDISCLKFDGTTDVLIFSGSNDIVEYYSACKIKEYNPEVDVRIVANVAHVVPAYLHQIVGLKNIINSYLLQGDKSFTDRCELFYPVSFAQGIEIRNFNEALFKGVIMRDAHETMEHCADQFPRWSMIQYFAALTSEAWGDINSCEMRLKRAVSELPSFWRARLKLGQLFNRQNRFKDCVALFEAASDDSMRRAPMALTLSLAQESEGDLVGALKTLEKIDPRFVRESISLRVDRLRERLKL